MQVVNIITIRKGIVDKNLALFADDIGNCINNPRPNISDRISCVAEYIFWEECRKINKNLPEMDDVDWENVDLNAFPSIDDGYYEFGNRTVCISWGTPVH